jgi:hypothetical protein
MHLMARSHSYVVLRYIQEAPLQMVTDRYKGKKGAVNAGQRCKLLVITSSSIVQRIGVYEIRHVGRFPRDPGLQTEAGCLTAA